MADVSLQDLTLSFFLSLLCVTLGSVAANALGNVHPD